jgi:NADH:quinone reductase (non-electrogenic)
MGLIHDIPTCEVLLKRIETEARDAVQQQAALFVEDNRAKL